MTGVREKVVVAMSGGVDSSVAAALLVEQGYDIVGFFMRTGVHGKDEGTEAQRHEGNPPLSPLGKGGGGGVAIANRQPVLDAQRQGSAIDNPSDRSLTVAARNNGPRGPKHAIGNRQSAIDNVGRRPHQGCCSASDAADARFVAGMLGVPFYALNFEKEFDRLIDYFADEYARGRTPNPCVVCNNDIKFGRIVDYADAVGARYLATGHYARIGERGGRKVLMRARDGSRDQSYVLFGLDRALLDRVIFPLGDLLKSEVREIARERGFPNWDKPDSVEICFAPDRDYARIVRERHPEAFAEGEVVDAAGRVVGRHEGIANFTVGQRRGLGIALGKPAYVTNLNVEANMVTLGEADDLLHRGLIADRVNFLVDLPASPTAEAMGHPLPSSPTAEAMGHPPASPTAEAMGHPTFRAEVKIRYLHKAAAATVEVIDETPQLPISDCQLPITTPRQLPSPQVDMGEFAAARGNRGRSGVRVIFDEPQRAITPGQAVVFYDGEVVIGGGWIKGAIHSDRECGMSSAEC